MDVVVTLEDDDEVIDAAAAAAAEELVSVLDPPLPPWKMRLSFQTLLSPNGSSPKVSMLSLESANSFALLSAGISKPPIEEEEEEDAATSLLIMRDEEEEDC